jgi:hypothetical protein
MIATHRSIGGLSVGYIWEVSYPVAAGVGAFAAVLSYGPTIFCIIDAGKVELSNIYTAIAGLFAIITGFLATFYGSLQSIVDTRLKRISKTRVFQRFIYYIKVATISGFVIALVTIPYIVLVPTASGTWAGRFWVAAWCGACTYGLATFLRVAGMLFFIFEHSPPEDDAAI